MVRPSHWGSTITPYSGIGFFLTPRDFQPISLSFYRACPHRDSLSRDDVSSFALYIGVVVKTCPRGPPDATVSAKTHHLLRRDQLRRLPYFGFPPLCWKTSLPDFFSGWSKPTNLDLKRANLLDLLGILDPVQILLSSPVITLTRAPRR
ncbi:hypothetical protein VNO77_39414 [Canavalia gladiata]|uniref:Uncharacterized protein n=1 Tax=Canavalia gladiata TaxID=3824 RepID=A0AAN9KD26_CANGL